MLLHYLAKRENTKIAFSLKCCTSALPEIHQSLLDFFNIVDSQLVLMLLYDSLNLVFNAFSSGLSGGMVHEKGSRKRSSSWTVLHAQCMCTNSLSVLKKKVVICDVFDSV